jgi:uncharacterized protein YxeA
MRMKKAVTLLTALVMILLVSSCVKKADVNRANHFLESLDALKTAEPAADLETLIDSSASVINLNARAFDLKKGWDKKYTKYKRYNYIFNSDGTLSLYLSMGKVEKTAYTFTVGSTSDIYDAGENLTASLGTPIVTLNSVESSQNDVQRAIKSGGDPDLRYCYEWTIDLEGQSIYIYLAYYYNSGTNFGYLVVCKPGKA